MKLNVLKDIVSALSKISTAQLVLHPLVRIKVKVRPEKWQDKKERRLIRLLTSPRTNQEETLKEKGMIQLFYFAIVREPNVRKGTVGAQRKDSLV